MSSSLNLKLKDYILTIFTAMAAALGPLRSLRRNLTYPKLMLEIIFNKILMREDDI